MMRTWGRAMGCTKDQRSMSRPAHAVKCLNTHGYKETMLMVTYLLLSGSTYVLLCRSAAAVISSEASQTVCQSLTAKAMPFLPGRISLPFYKQQHNATKRLSLVCPCLLPINGRITCQLQSILFSPWHSVQQHHILVQLMFIKLVRCST